MYILTYTPPPTRGLLLPLLVLLDQIHRSEMQLYGASPPCMSAQEESLAQAGLQAAYEHTPNSLLVRARTGVFVIAFDHCLTIHLGF